MIGGQYHGRGGANRDRGKEENHSGRCRHGCETSSADALLPWISGGRLQHLMIVVAVVVSVKSGLFNALVLDW